MPPVSSAGASKVLDGNPNVIPAGFPIDFLHVVDVVEVDVTEVGFRPIFLRLLCHDLRHVFHARAVAVAEAQKVPSVLHVLAVLHIAIERDVRASVEPTANRVGQHIPA